MPRVFQIGGLRFFFYSNEGREPPHVHVRREMHEAKIWLHDGSVAINVGFAAHELRHIIDIVRERRAEIEEAWHEHFDR